MSFRDTPMSTKHLLNQIKSFAINICINDCSATFFVYHFCQLLYHIQVL